MALLLLFGGAGRVQAKRRQGSAPTPATPATRPTEPASGSGTPAGSKAAAGSAAKRTATSHSPAHRRTATTAAAREATGSGAATSSSAKTRSASARRRRKTYRESTQTAPTPERVSEIQSALAAHGAYQGTPSGRWDEATVEAMKQFQSAHGLTPTGKLDALSLQKLGLGSDVAGVGAPLPLKNPQPDELTGATVEQTPVAADKAPEAASDKTAQADQAPQAEKTSQEDQTPPSDKTGAPQAPPPAAGQNP